MCMCMYLYILYSPTVIIDRSKMIVYLISGSTVIVHFEHIVSETIGYSFQSWNAHEKSYRQCLFFILWRL